MQTHSNKRSGQDRRRLDMYSHLDETTLSQMRPNRRLNHRRLGIPYQLIRKESLPIEVIHISDVMRKSTDTLRKVG